MFQFDTRTVNETHNEVSLFDVYAHRWIILIVRGIHGK